MSSEIRRIAIVTESIDPRRGGAETSIVEMATAFTRRSVAVELWHPELPLDLSGRLERSYDAGITPAPLPVGGGTKLARTRRFIDAAERHARSADVDVIHAVTPCPAAHVYQPRGGTYRETIFRTLAVNPSPLQRWAKALGRKFNLRQQYLQRVEERLLRRSPPPYVACVSNYVRRQVVEINPDLGAHATVVFNGVAAKPLSEHAWRAVRARLRRAIGGIVDAQTRAVLFVGHNFKLKGLRELLEAFVTPALRGQPLTLWIAGRDDRRPYEALARQMGIAEVVRFIGTDYETSQLYAAADVLCHPTWYDPCSRVVLEALVQQIPVVTTKWNGAAELLVEGRNGRVISDPANANELGQAILSCLPRMSERAPPGRSPEDDWLSMDRHVDELLQLYGRAREDRAARARPV